MAATSHIGFQSPVEDSCPTDGLGIVAMMLLAITFQSPVEDSCPTDAVAWSPLAPGTSWFQSPVEDSCPTDIGVAFAATTPADSFSPLSRIHAPLTVCMAKSFAKQ